MAKPFSQDAAKGRSRHPQFKVCKGDEVPESGFSEDIIACVDSSCAFGLYGSSPMVIKLSSGGVKTIKKTQSLLCEIFKTVKR